MKKIISSILCLSIVCISMAGPVSAIELRNLDTNSISTRGIERNVDSINNYSLQENTIRLNTTRHLNLFNQFWTGFGFVQRADGRYFLKNISNGIYYDYTQINPSDLLHARTTFIFRNSDNEVYSKLDFRIGTRMKDLAFELFKISSRMGDSIQIIINDSATRDASITGFINNNLSSVNYEYNLSPNNSRHTAFRLDEAGLYAQYIDQDILPDGNYNIRSDKKQNKSLSVIKGNNSVKAVSTNIEDTQQQFNLTYDNVMKAYRIKNLNTGDYLSWNSTMGDDVIHFGGGDYYDQLWYLKYNPFSESYALVNAHNFYKFLNLDSNESNISVAYERGNTNQQFIFDKIN